MDDWIKRVKRDLKFFPTQKLYFYKELEETIPKIYVKVSSDKQISTIYKSYLKDQMLLKDFYYSLIILLTKQYKIEEDKIIKLLKKKDLIIYKFLKENRGRNYNRKYKFLNSQIKKCILSSYNKKIKNYLDVGCLDGNKTEMTGKYLGLKKKDIYCLNLESDKTFIGGKQSKNIIFKTYNGIENFPLEDNFFSLITYDSVLHHVENIDHVLKETHRILRKGGLLLVREHDARTDFDKMLCDISHINFRYLPFESQKASLRGEEIIDIKDIEQTGNYISWLELNYIITSHNFTLKNHIKDPIYKNELNNVTRTYYSLYQKI